MQNSSSIPTNLISNLAERLKKHNKLENIINILVADYALVPRIGVEIEFYLRGKMDILKFTELLEQELKSEKGASQYEIELKPSTNLINYVKQINEIRDHIKNYALKVGGEALFEPKPFANDYGSSMHFHLDFLSDWDINLAANSLCHFMLETFLALLPKEQDYLRLDQNFMAPTHVSRGGNNRSLAIRIPDSLPKRLEHRIASANCDPYLITYIILRSVLNGVQNPQGIKKYEIIYGNAFDPQYDLTPLPKTIKEAEKLFNIDFFKV